MRTWIILDVSFLAHRVFHTTGRLSYDAEPAGIAFGVLRDIRTLAADLGGDDFVFAFDSPPGLREGSYPFYKQRRRTRRLSDGEEAARGELQHQIDELKTDYLPALGYGNAFASKGFEADDAIASVAANLPDGDLAVVVSADKDLEIHGDKVRLGFIAPRDVPVHREEVYEAIHAKPVTDDGSHSTPTALPLCNWSQTCRE